MSIPDQVSANNDEMTATDLSNEDALDLKFIEARTSENSESLDEYLLVLKRRGLL